MVQWHRWEANGGKAVAGRSRGIRGEVVGWYLPVRVMNEEALSGAGVRVVVQMRRVAVGRSAGAYTCIHTGSGDQEQEGVVYAYCQ